MDEEPEDRYVTESMAAEFMCLAQATLATWRSMKVGPKWVKLSAGRSGAVRYSMAELRKFMADPISYGDRKVGEFRQSETND